jgi:hypothetical protein
VDIYRTTRRYTPEGSTVCNEECLEMKFWADWTYQNLRKQVRMFCIHASYIFLLSWLFNDAVSNETI